MHYIIQLNYVNLEETDELIGWFMDHEDALDRAMEHNGFQESHGDYDDDNYTVAEVISCDCDDRWSNHTA